MAARHLPSALDHVPAHARHRRRDPAGHRREPTAPQDEPAGRGGLTIAFVTLVAALVVGCFSYLAYGNVAIAVFAALPVCLAAPLVLRSLID
jgi:hypothetical protein